jgi:hypothetical protein
MFAAEIVQHCSTDLLSANHCHHESMSFVWQGRHMQTNRGINSAYYSRERTAHAPTICTKNVRMPVQKTFVN